MIGFQRVNCHMVFDVKMEYFRRKVRLVAGGHLINTPVTITYAILVSLDTVIIALTISAFDNFPVKVANIRNSYITEHVTEKMWTVLGREFG